MNFEEASIQVIIGKSQTIGQQRQGQIWLCLSYFSSVDFKESHGSEYCYISSCFPIIEKVSI
jgi:hypothetical protein